MCIRDRQHSLTLAEYQTLIEAECEETRTYAAQRAVAVRQAVYGTDIFLRGLIEVTSYCRNDCYYCGIRKSNQACQRYLLSDKDILTCCAEGYRLGFRTFVLQEMCIRDRLRCRRHRHGAGLHPGHLRYGHHP